MSNPNMMPPYGSNGNRPYRPSVPTDRNITHHVHRGHSNPHFRNPNRGLNRHHFRRHANNRHTASRLNAYRYKHHIGSHHSSRRTSNTPPPTHTRAA